MEALDELRSLKTLTKAIAILKNEIRAKRLDLELPSGVQYSKIRIQSTAEDRIAEKIEAIQEKERELRQMLLDREIARKKIISRICKLEDARHVELLLKVYVDQKTIEQAAEEIGFGPDHAKRLHSAAVKAYQKEIKR